MHIAEARKELGLHRAEFGKLLGVSYNTVRSWEDDRRGMPRTAVLYLRAIFTVRSLRVALPTNLPDNPVWKEEWSTP